MELPNTGMESTGMVKGNIDKQEKDPASNPDCVVSLHR